MTSFREHKSNISALGSSRPAHTIYEIRYEEFCANPHNYLYNIAKIMGIDPNGFKERSYSHISSTNYKYKEDQDENDIREISQIMEPILKEKGYGI